MYAATTNGTIAARVRAHPQMTARRPNVATNSLNICAGPERACCEAKNSGGSHMTQAAAPPGKRQTTCATTYSGTSLQGRPPCEASASVTAGLKCAPEI